MPDQSSLFGEKELPPVQGAGPQQKPTATAGASSASQPLAARMRPRSLDEIIGQEHLLVPGCGSLRRSMSPAQSGLSHDRCRCPAK